MSLTRRLWKKVYLGPLTFIFNIALNIESVGNIRYQC